MASIVPPLDFVPKLPGKSVDLLSDLLNRQLDQLTEIASQTVQDSVKLPTDCNCDDPRVKKIKQQLTDVQKQITDIQNTVPKIQQTVDSVKQVVNTAQSIKAAISIAQLSNPVTAPLFIAQQLMAIQDATIVNAISSLNQFATLPQQLTDRLQTVVTPLLSAVGKVSNVCNGDVETLTVPESLTRLATTDNDYNDSASTDFYNELNVADSDLSSRSEKIGSLLRQQRNLLDSLQEAPSQVYKQEGPPPNELGKPGDYYINLTTNQIYGPKISIDDWGTPVN